MKVFINIIGSNGEQGFNAAGKAKKDVEHTLTSLGYERHNLYFRKDYSKIKRTLVHFKDLINLCSTLIKKHPEEIIIQYPGMGVGTRSISLITKLLRSQNLTLLIHDIDSLRYFGKISKREKDIMNRASLLLVHTNNMKVFLQNAGISTPMKVIELFDYYASEKPNVSVPTLPYSIVFAGNLEKSIFLKHIGSSLSPHTLYIYGVEVDIKWPKGIVYEGKFKPDCIDNIKGDWGLVWDGDCINKCSGMIGNYLKYNSSHKASLYLAAGKPIIVWSESALAEVVTKYKIGIVINNLGEIPTLLESISLNMFKEFQENIYHISENLRKGNFLRSTII